MVQELDAQSFATFTAQDGLTVVDFWAPWCGPCVQFTPRFQKIAEDFPKVHFGKINAEDHSEVARVQGIRSLPTFKLFKNGKEVDVVNGANDGMLRKAITKAM